MEVSISFKQNVRGNGDARPRDGKLLQYRKCIFIMTLINSGVTMGARGRGNVPPSRGLCPSGAPHSEFWKIGSHLRLQDTKYLSIDMPPTKSDAPPSAPLENWTLVTPLLILVIKHIVHLVILYIQLYLCVFTCLRVSKITIVTRHRRHCKWG